MIYDGIHTTQFIGIQNFLCGSALGVPSNEVLSNRERTGMNYSFKITRLRKLIRRARFEPAVSFPKWKPKLLLSSFFGAEGFSGSISEFGKLPDSLPLSNLTVAAGLVDKNKGSVLT
jgi:hypothetical protein